MTVSTRLSSVLQGPRCCPYCLSSNTKDSSWKNSAEKAGRFWLRPVRCRNCHKRFVRFRRVPLAAFAGLVFVGISALVVITVQSAGSRIPSEHERKLAELDPRDVARIRAEAGSSLAQFEYAMLLSQGGTSEREDLVEAIKWFEKAAAQGHAQAQYELAQVYKLGRGTLQDYDAAARWFMEAARKGHVAAQYHMGRLHRIGEGVDLDLIRAYAWFNRAAALGHGAARGARDEIAASLKPEQVEAAQKLSRDLLSAPSSALTSAPTTAPTASGLTADASDSAKPESKAESPADSGRVIGVTARP